MIFFLFPTLYTFKTRLNSKNKILAWFLSFLFPCLFTACYFSDVLNYVELLLAGGVAVIAIYNTYEVGYIYNDAELTKKETSPTIRLNNEETEYYERNKLKIYLVRGIQLILILIILSFFSKALSISVAVSCAIILLVYLFYNSIRSVINIPLYSLLVWLRYFGISLAFYNLTDVVLLWLVYPLCVTVEFSSKPRFSQSLRWIYNHIDLFRVVYYSLLLIISTSILSYLGIFYDYLWFFFLASYYFLFRFLSYFFLSKRYRAQ